MLFRSTIAMKCFQERYAVILAIKLISDMRRIQKVINKIANHLFCAVQPINNSKKQNNCFRQSFHTDLENVTNTATLYRLMSFGFFH